MSLENMTMDQLKPPPPVAPREIPEFEVDEPISFDEPREASLLRRVVVKVRLLPMVIFFSKS